MNQLALGRKLVVIEGHTAHIPPDLTYWTSRQRSSRSGPAVVDIPRLPDMLFVEARREARLYATILPDGEVVWEVGRIWAGSARWPGLEWIEAYEAGLRARTAEATERLGEEIRRAALAWIAGATPGEALQAGWVSRWDLHGVYPGVVQDWDYRILVRDYPEAWAQVQTSGLDFHSDDRVVQHLSIMLERAWSKFAYSARVWLGLAEPPEGDGGWGPGYPD